MNRFLKTLISGVVILVSTVLVSAAADWPGFRGRDGDGISEDDGFPTEWSQDKNVRWRIDLPNRGNESPIICNGCVFATSGTNDGRTRRLHCFDRKSGSELWVREVTVDGKEATHKTNPFGAATPAARDDRVVVWHGSAGLYCYDFAGKELWHADLGKVGHIWGYGSSPVIHDGLVFLNYGPGTEQFLVAVKLSDGEVAWKVSEPGGNNARQGTMAGSWSTPVIVNRGGDTQLICSMPTRVVSLKPGTGHLIWECQGLTGRNGNLVYTSPVVADDVVICMGGYSGPALAVRMGGLGDVTESHRVWHITEKTPQRISSGIVVGDHLFMANAGPGTIQCLDVATGKEVWKDRGPGASYWGAMTFAAGYLYVTDQAGATVVFEPDVDGFRLIATNQLDSTSNSTPAFSDGEIFLRTASSLYCLTAQ
ncbi:MAG: PQQ-binding-like beta-propeller repeat protein [Planctomycetaceae bacterium]